MAPKLVTHLAPGGSVVLSGILAAQRWKVLAAYNGARHAPCQNHLAERLGDDPSRSSLKQWVKAG